MLLKSAGINGLTNKTPMTKEEKQLWHEIELWFQREEFRKKLKEISQRIKDTPSPPPYK